MTLRMLQQLDWDSLEEPARRMALKRPAMRTLTTVAAEAAEVIAAVRRDGDAALMALTERFDGVRIINLRVSDEEAAAADNCISADARAAIQTAIANITRFHSAQITAAVRVETAPGVVCERVTRPLRGVGLYVPAGNAALPSTAMMLAIPAALAGCALRVLCTPPRRDGRADPAVVVAARACGVRDIFKVGGAQAIAAMAFGTDSIPKVDKIFGPGNAWVTAAKQAVALDPEAAAIDMPAGPSEVMVIADAQANARFVAMDLLSQAEHGHDSHVVLVTTDPGLVSSVRNEIRSALPNLPRRSVIEDALAHSTAVLVRDLDQAVDVANRYAPEHLILQVSEPRRWIGQIYSAGSVFLGAWTPESVGDYCSGTNHVLPTYGYARTYSGLSVTDFQRHMTLQELTPAGLMGLGPTVETLAQLEGLEAHAEAVRVRLRAQQEACR